MKKGFTVSILGAFSLARTKLGAIYRNVQQEIMYHSTLLIGWGDLSPPPYPGFVVRKNQLNIFGGAASCDLANYSAQDTGGEKANH